MVKRFSSYEQLAMIERHTEKREINDRPSDKQHDDSWLNFLPLYDKNESERRGFRKEHTTVWLFNRASRQTLNKRRL